MQMYDASMIVRGRSAIPASTVTATKQPGRQAIRRKPPKKLKGCDNDSVEIRTGKAAVATPAASEQEHEDNDHPGDVYVAYTPCARVNDRPTDCCAQLGPTADALGNERILT